MMTETLENRLIRHEGYRSIPYLDTNGYWTIGIGHLLTESNAKNDYPDGISYDDAVILFKKDIAQAKLAVAREMPWSLGVDDVRLGVLIEMAFQLGIAGVLKFVNMIAGIRAQDWEKASQSMLNSAWHRQTPGRCEELANIILTGESA